MDNLQYAELEQLETEWIRRYEVAETDEDHDHAHEMIAAIQCVMLVHRRKVEELEAKNERLREALIKIRSPHVSDPTPENIAREALK